MPRRQEAGRPMLGARHQASGLNAHFAGTGLPFGEYVRYSQDMLRQAHAGQERLEQRVSGNAPFELHPAASARTAGGKPYRRGVVLTHGLSDSPYHMHHLAAFFQRNGFRVMVLLLPGHGTQPGDLLDMHWQEWNKTVAYGADCMAAEVDELYLAGFSAGGALSVLQAARDERVRGLFLFSPALEITSRARWANLHQLYSWLLPQAAWVNVYPDRDLYKYESFCKNAAVQMYALTQALPQREVAIPVFAVASADDTTVHSNATLRFMQQASHPASRLVWYAPEGRMNPSPTGRGAGVRGEASSNIEWINSYIPDQHILSSAHTAIVMPPEDAHYGAQGSYANCLHYCADESHYAACLSGGGDICWGEVTAANLQRGLLRRLTWNPHYREMEASMLRFIEELP